MTVALTVVGIGADGWAGLGAAARAAVTDAEVVLGSARQLALVDGRGAGMREAWPSPLVPALPGVLQRHAGRRVCALASGDPMFFGLGTTLCRLLGPGRVRVLPHVSSATLACARLGWAVESVDVLSLVARPPAAVFRVLHPGRRLLLLAEGAGGPAAVAGLLVGAGFGASRVTVLEQLGGPAERVVDGTADGWAHPPGDPLAVVAVECAGEAGHGLVPGLPDDAFVHDGQLTKRDVRAVTLGRLAPRPGELLWDVGAGAGSIAIEWSRAHPTCRAVAVESRPERAAAIGLNAAALGVPGVRVVTGRAPAALAGLPEPDAVFVGGGATRRGVLDVCWAALRPGGRLVVNAVTVEAEAVLAARYAAHGGELTRISVARAAPVGGFTGWRPAMPVTQWVLARP